MKVNIHNIIMFLAILDDKFFHQSIIQEVLRGTLSELAVISNAYGHTDRHI